MKQRLVIYAVLLVAVWGYLEWRTRAPSEVLLVLAADGSLLVNGEPATVDTLAQRIPDATRPVRVVVDPRVPVPALVAVVDGVKAAGIADVQVESRE